MSDTGRDKREWRFYLEDMIEFSLKVQSYTEGMSQTVFIENTVTYDATLRNLELIGEAATHIPKEIQSANPDIPWRLIIATRNRLIHAYLGIDDDTIWSIIQDDSLEASPATTTERLVALLTLCIAGT